MKPGDLVSFNFVLRQKNTLDPTVIVARLGESLTCALRGFYDCSVEKSEIFMIIGNLPGIQKHHARMALLMPYNNCYRKGATSAILVPEGSWFLALSREGILAIPDEYLEKVH